MPTKTKAKPKPETPTARGAVRPLSPIEAAYLDQHPYASAAAVAKHLGRPAAEVKRLMAGRPKPPPKPAPDRKTHTVLTSADVFNEMRGDPAKFEASRKGECAPVWRTKSPPN